MQNTSENKNTISSQKYKKGLRFLPEKIRPSDTIRPHGERSGHDVTPPPALTPQALQAFCSEPADRGTRGGHSGTSPPRPQAPAWHSAALGASNRSGRRATLGKSPDAGDAPKERRERPFYPILTYLCREANPTGPYRTAAAPREKREAFPSDAPRSSEIRSHARPEPVWAGTECRSGRPAVRLPGRRRDRDRKSPRDPRPTPRNSASNEKHPPGGAVRGRERP